MKKTDLVYLGDILDAVNKVDEFLDGYSYDDFKNDDKTIFAVCHALEIVGEASNQLSANFRNDNPEFPVRQTVEMRNFLIHGYDQIDIETIWDTIKNDLPSLKKLTEQLYNL